MNFILKDNSEEIRKKIRDADIHVCICCEFIDSCWLNYSTNVANRVHGVGYYGGEMFTNSQEEAISLFLHECKEPVFCKDVQEFIDKILEFQKTIKDG